MAKHISPGINVSEINLTTVVPAVSSTVGAIAGVFPWGPTLQPILVSSEVDLVARFGKPKTRLNIETFYTASDFLSYTNALYVVRVDSGDKAIAEASSDIDLMGFRAKYKGRMGNSITIQVVNGGTNYQSADPSIYPYLTGARRVVRGAPKNDRHIHIAVVDADGEFTGQEGALLEVYENLSLREGSKDNEGRNNFWIDVVNESSNYIETTYDGDPEAVSIIAAYSEQLRDGQDGDDENNIEMSKLLNGYDLFRNVEDIDISLIMQGVASASSEEGHLASYITQMAAERMDCIAFASPPRSAVLTSQNTTSSNALNNIVSWSDQVVSTTGDERTLSYLVLDSGYKYRYDRHNDRYIYTPLNGDIAGICAKTDDTNDPWFSPAGYNRGGVKNVLKLAYNPVKADRDELYRSSINPVVSRPGEGTVLFGDKTAVRVASAFDRINVRRLFIVLEKAISRASKAMLFEFNDEFTRAQFVNMVEPFLRDVQGRRGIYAFRVVCDESNNTPQVVDTNQFVGDIYIKPARSINFIQLNFVAVGTGIEFNEIIGNN